MIFAFTRPELTGFQKCVSGRVTMSRSALQSFEGCQVSVALRGGERIDDCQLVSAGRSSTRTVWLFSNGVDLFVELDDVIDVWGAAGRPLAA